MSETRDSQDRGEDLVVQGEERMPIRRAMKKINKGNKKLNNVGS